MVGPSSSSLSESTLGRGKLGSSSPPESSRSLNDESKRSIASCAVYVAIGENIKGVKRLLLQLQPRLLVTYTHAKVRGYNYIGFCYLN